LTVTQDYMMLVCIILLTIQVTCEHINLQLADTIQT